MISDLHMIPIVTYIIIPMNLHQSILWDRKVKGSRKEACTGSRISITPFDCYLRKVEVAYLWLVVSLLDEKPLSIVELCGNVVVKKERAGVTHVTVRHTIQRSERR